jgi:hypothetical protein
MYLATSLAHMGLLASVHSLMDGQGRTLNELLVATRMITDVRSDTTVDSFYRKISLSPSVPQVCRHLPCRARSLLRANPLPHVLHGNAFWAVLSPDC